MKVQLTKKSKVNREKRIAEIRNRDKGIVIKLEDIMEYLDLTNDRIVEICDLLKSKAGT